MLKKRLAMACLLASVSAPASELDDLVNSSNAIVGQLDKGIQYVGAATMMTSGTYGIAPLNAQQSAHLSEEQRTAYNQALSNMSNFTAYTASEFFTDQGELEIDAMNDAIDVFTEVVVDLSTVVTVNEMAVEAAETDNVQQQEDLQDFVAVNEMSLEISAEDVESYNTSLDDVAEHAANAAAYLTVANHEGASQFMQNGADEAGQRFSDAGDNVSFNHASGMVLLEWFDQGLGYGVFVNGQDAFAIDVFLSDSDVLSVGSNSSYYLTGPTAQSSDCYFGTEECTPAVNPGPQP